MYVADGLEICQLLEKGYFRLNARAGARIQIHHHMPPHCVEIWHKWCRLFMSKKILVPVQLTKITSQSTSVRTPRMPPPSAGLHWPSRASGLPRGGCQGGSGGPSCLPPFLEHPFRGFEGACVVLFLPSSSRHPVMVGHSTDFQYGPKRPVSSGTHLVLLCHDGNQQPQAGGSSEPTKTASMRSNYYKYGTEE